MKINVTYIGYVSVTMATYCSELVDRWSRDNHYYNYTIPVSLISGCRLNNKKCAKQGFQECTLDWEAGGDANF